MPRLRKASFNKTVEFVTTSVEQGIMLPCNPVLKYIICAALSRAQELHNIEICHIIVEGTHIHMIVVINNPEDLPKFMERFKTESAHYINRLLGRKKRTVWCEGYDNPTLLTKEDVINKIIYLYTNPVKDNLSKNIKSYPGINSWNNFKSNFNYIDANIISRDILFPIAKSLNYREYCNLKRLVHRNSIRKRRLKLNFNGWMRCFNIETQEEINFYSKQIIELVEKEEKEISQNKTYPSVSKLLSEDINLDYIPDRHGRKMWCISEDIKKRIEFISLVKKLSKQAKAVYKKWKSGDFNTPFPVGMFPPRMRIQANLLLSEALLEYS